MSTPQQLPLKVLFKGPSTFVWTSMMGGPRTDLVFPRVMEAELLGRGQAVDVWNAACNGWLTRDLFATWEDEVSSWSPDVIVIAPAHMESIHAILPPWLERAANSISRRPTLWNKLFYRRVMRLLARGVLHLQRRIDRPGGFHGRVKRALAEAEAWLTITRQVGSPLVLLLEVHPPTQKKIGWFPGWPSRMDLLNDSLRAMAERHDNAEFLPIRDLMGAFDPGTPEQLWADGIHFSPDFHRAVGERLADRVEKWAGEQPHLAQP